MLYRVLLFVHVMGAITWFGAGLAFQFTAERARDRASIQAIARFNDQLGKHYFMVASMIVLAAGIGLVIVGGWGFGQVFVIGGLVGFATSSFVGAALIGRSAEAVSQRLDDPAAGDGQVQEAFKRLRNFGRLDLAIMAVVVFLMTVKPGT